MPIFCRVSLDVALEVVSPFEATPLGLAEGTAWCVFKGVFPIGSAPVYFNTLQKPLCIHCLVGMRNIEDVYIA